PRPKPAAPPLPAYSSRAVLPVVVIVVAAALFIVQSSLRSALAEAWIGESSLTSLERAVAVAPERPLAWMRLGIRQSRDGDSGSALASLETAVERAPSSSPPRIRLALELERERRFDDG